uniref:Ig-like domain-containing protein n=1 Tax=Periophthalmus magnuspinnatus TaxID=409849 RepID=A0A3B4BE20_9GOBI
MPPAVHLETPSFQIIETAVSQITATCSVHSVVKASVTWLLDGQPSAYKSYETVKSPPLEELQQNATRLTVSCLLVGPSLDSFTVTWKINEQIESGGVHAEAPVLQSNGTQTLLSHWLHLTPTDMLPGALYTCRVTHATGTSDVHFITVAPFAQ